MRNETPQNWSDAIERLARVLGGTSPEPRAAAEEWLRTAVAARYGVWSLHDLTRGQRQVAFQKACGAVLALESEPGDLAFTLGVRRLVAAVLARFYAGAVPDGPPWRLGPDELDRPTYAEWCVDQDDDSIPSAGGSQPAEVR